MLCCARLMMVVVLVVGHHRWWWCLLPARSGPFAGMMAGIDLGCFRSDCRDVATFPACQCSSCSSVRAGELCARKKSPRKILRSYEGGSGERGECKNEESPARMTRAGKQVSGFSAAR